MIFSNTLQHTEDDILPGWIPIFFLSVLIEFIVVVECNINSYHIIIIESNWFLKQVTDSMCAEINCYGDITPRLTVEPATPWITHKMLYLLSKSAGRFTIGRYYICFVSVETS